MEGPTLGRPMVDRVNASRHHNMKELRYDANIPLADKRYDEHLAELDTREYR